MNSVTFDIGLSNIAYWNAFGITVRKYGHINNSIPHPHPHNDPGRRLSFFASIPHVAKNNVQSVVNNKKIYILKDIQQDCNLPTDVVDAAHLVEIFNSVSTSRPRGLSV